jgi:ABC-2 type transport system permease protein/sodium transport system permease protein
MRGPEAPQSTASVATALLCVAVLFPVFYNLQGLVGQFAELTISDRLWTISVLTALLFAVFPLMVALWRKVRLVSGFGLRRPAIHSMAGALLLGLSLWALVHELNVLQQNLGIGKLEDAFARRIADMFRQIKTQPLWMLLVTMAVVPAACEEFFFRGMVYHALAARGRPRQAIVVSAVLFGLFHIFALGGLATPRLLPSTLMGLILGWVCYRTGSVLPGMLLHACHNGAALTVAYYVEELDVDSWGILDQPHLPPWWLVAAGVGSALGVATLALFRNDRDQGDSAPI